MDFIKDFLCINELSSKHFKGRNIQANVWKIIPEILHTTNIAETSRNLFVLFIHGYKNFASQLLYKSFFGEYFFVISHT